MGIRNSSFWYDGNGTNGTISFCTLTELMSLDGDMPISVSFIKKPVSIIFDFAVGFFSIDGVDVIANQISGVDKSSEFEVSACICSSSNVCDNNATVSQNSAVNICVMPTDAGIQVKKFSWVEFNQDGVLYYPVQDGEAN